MAKADASIADAREKFGDVEVFDRQIEKAQLIARTGDLVSHAHVEVEGGAPDLPALPKWLCTSLPAIAPSLLRRHLHRYQLYPSLQAGALAAYADISGKHISTGQKTDMAMAKARLALQHGDYAAAKDRIAEAKE